MATGSVSETAVGMPAVVREVLLGQARPVPWVCRDEEWASGGFRDEPDTEELYGLVPEDDCDMPEGPPAWWTGLAAELLDGYRDDAEPDMPQRPEIIKAGFWDRGSGDGGGFAAGGVADGLEPGPVLAGFADDAWRGGLGRLSDDELIGVLRAGRRLAARAAAIELAAAGDLMCRRIAEEEAGQRDVAKHAVDEIAAALTLTGRSADRELDLAMSLSQLPATAAALAAGDIDLPRASVIADELALLGPADRGAVERHVLARACSQNTAQLRAAARRSVIAADPAAARTRKEQAAKDARVERWEETGGTAALAGRDLPPAGVLAADKHLTALARHLKTAGVAGTMDQLRAAVYLTLLSGQPLETLLPAPGSALSEPASTPADPAPPAPAQAETAPAEAGQAGAGQGRARQAGSGHSWPGPAGSVNLTMPLATWLGLAEAPGDAAGFGPLDAYDSRALAAMLASRHGTHWCLTLTGPDGRPAAHGCATPTTHRRTRAGPAPGWTFTITPLQNGTCTHPRESSAYQPPPKLRHLLHIRHPRCTFPGCRRPATQCDLDHTLAHHRGGRTCECNMAPLCRHHHEAKQTTGWELQQPEPGTLIWRLPHGRTYTVKPEPYPD